MLKTLILFSLSVLLICSCRKDDLSCNNSEMLVGSYKIPETNKVLTINYQATCANCEKEYSMNLPKIKGYKNFSMNSKSFQKDDCSFELVCYDNYATSGNGPQYWMTSKGKGHFEPNKVVIEYRVEIQVNYEPWPAEPYKLLDSVFSNTFIKN